MTTVSEKDHAKGELTKATSPGGTLEGTMDFYDNWAKTFDQVMTIYLQYLQ